MWNRKELKEKGKAAFRANRITCIFAAFLLTLAVSGTTGFGSPLEIKYSTDGPSLTFFGVQRGEIQELIDDYSGEEDDLVYDYDGLSEDEDYIDDSDEFVYDEDYDEPDASIGDSSLPPIFGVIFGGILLVVIVVAVGISVFVLNPMSVGLYKFFLDNSDNPSVGLTRSNIGLGFSNHYMNFVGAIFATELFTFLWTLLLIVPGIIKQLEWRMVRYILAENPEMSGADARTLSSEMMDGNKWDAFVLDLSFIGWTLLGAITLGIGNIIWTNPYHAATNTELYLALKTSRLKTDNTDSEEHSDIANAVSYESDVEVEVE